MKREPGSQRPATRSRAVSLPCLCCFSALSGPPPWRRRSSSARTSARSSRSGLVTAASGFLMRLLGEPSLDVLDQLGGRRARAEQLARAHGVERVHVFLRDDATAGDQDVVAPLLFEQRKDARKERHVR